MSHCVLFLSIHFICILFRFVLFFLCRFSHMVSHVVFYIKTNEFWCLFYEVIKKKYFFYHTRTSGLCDIHSVLVTGNWCVGVLFHLPKPEYDLFFYDFCLLLYFVAFSRSFCAFVTRDELIEYDKLNFIGTHAYEWPLYWDIHPKPAPTHEKKTHIEKRTTSVTLAVSDDDFSLDRFRNGAMSPLPFFTL